ncbi:polysaccharide deacetylase family protein [Pelosinus fermentans]|uniref:Polysaccharide deacetylase n=1 Tax=Pelosinus fermentans JBW45 TaxID=1192197 RepID=I9NMH6_9FIRM|nr:polysaccharide deacetylase family protein [Pelosinus fermentans]AJQ26840.1 polysaccharide deacetylase [Pelosinus fermentans JBW45]
MKTKIIVSSLVLFIGACLIGIFFFKDFFTAPTGGDYRNITDIESSYNAEAEIAQALAKMKSSQDKATVIMRSNSGQRQIALTFDGLTDSTSMQQILDLLKKHNVKATFFVDGMQTAEDPQTVVNIKKAGHKIENYSLLGISKMEALPVERVVKDFSRAQKIIKVITDQGPNLLKCNDTNYTDQLLQAAKACGFNSVVKSDVFLNVKQINSLSAADVFVGKLKPGSILSVKLKPNTERIVNEPGKTDLRPAIDKQPGLKELPQEANLGEKETIAAVERLLTAINKANYTTVYVEDFATDSSMQNPVKTTFFPNSINNVKESTHYSFFIKMASFLQEEFTTLFIGRTAYAAESVNSEAQEIKLISTTEPALSYTFGGLANETVVNDVLTRLHRLGIKATFFVAEVEMRKYPETLRRIIENGHEIGIAIRPKDGETADETRSTILRDSKKLQEQFGVATNLVKQPWGAVSDTTKEVIFSLGYKLIGQSVNVVQNKHKDYTSADQVMAEIFGKSMLSLARGQIVHFRMDYYANDRLVGDLAEIIKQRKVDNIAYATFYDNPVNNLSNDSQYTIKPVGEILNNTRFIYRYPVDLATVPAHLKNDGSEQMIDTHNFLAEASKRYIGNRDVNDNNNMLGFSKMDTRRLDKSGLIHTKDNVIFITFDDWGTDASVNKILYVLRKHNVPATFFILTHNVVNNPNLLRTIAMQGHNIGDHSDKHKPMVVRDPKTGKQVNTQGKEEYIQELATSYQKLLTITGDVNVNGKPMLTKFFRPPTLAISKMGIEVLFETGYEFIVSGSCNTNDYRAKNVPQLEKIIEDGVYTENGEVRKGAILVLHMLDSAAYTAIALDILLTANEAKADSDPSKFKVGRLSDYLIDGYSQISRKSLK